VMKLVFAYPPQPNKESLYDKKPRGKGFNLFFYAWLCSAIIVQLFRLKFVQNFLKKKFNGFGKQLETINSSPDVKKSLWAQLANPDDENSGFSENDDDSKKGKFTLEEYTCESVGLLAAGFETTATALSWVLYMIHKHPAVHEKLRNEIQKIIGDRIPTYSDTKKLKYLDKVIFESIRCHGIVTTVGREVAKQDTIGGFTIPVGTHVYSSPRQVGRDDFGPNPGKFDPDRFSEENSQDLMKISLLNFGYGPHVCIGKLGPYGTSVNHYILSTKR